MQQPQRRTRERTNRRGAALVEAAITLSAFLILVLGMLDLGIGVLRYNTIAEAARTGARAAIVHGSLATQELSPWDDTAAKNEITTLITPLLNAVGIPVTSDTVAVLHTDRSVANGGDANTTTNDPGISTAGDTVTVTVGAPFTPLMTFIFGGSTITLTAKTTMVIAH